jgi:hypothetical protein
MYSAKRSEDLREVLGRGEGFALSELIFTRFTRLAEAHKEEQRFASGFRYGDKEGAEMLGERFRIGRFPHCIGKCLDRTVPNRHTEPLNPNAVHPLRVDCRLIATSIFVVVASVSVAVAQEPADSSRLALHDPFEYRTTIEGWAESRRHLVLDRKHSIGGRLYDRGIFRHVTPKTNREYAHEMLVQRFSSEAFNERRRARNSLLLRIGSIRRDLLAFVSRIRSRVPLDTAHALTLDAVLQQDGQATRSFLELGYTWQFAPRHALGVRHTFSEYKRDVDPTILYRYAGRRLGSAEVALTFQNLYSDILDQQLGIFPGDREVIRDYIRHPYLFSFSYASPDHLPLRGEVAGGIQPTSRAIYASQRKPEYRYRDDRRLHYLGAVLEYRYASVAGGFFYKRDVSRLRRVGTGENVASDYTARQQFQRFGPFLKGRWGPFQGMVRGFLGSYQDRQTGKDYSESVLPENISYDEGQHGLQGRLLYEPDSGLSVGLEYAALRRRYAREDDPSRVGNGSIVFAPWTEQYWGLGPSNHGLVGRIGYRFSGGELVTGVGYDLDGDDDYPTKDLGTRRFDGAFGRLILTW